MEKTLPTASAGLPVQGGPGDAQSAVPPAASAALRGTATSEGQEAVTASQLRMVMDVSKMLAVPTDLDALLFRIAKAATSLLDCERASIFLHDPRSDELWTKVALDSPEIRAASNIGIVGHAFKSNAPVQVLDPYHDPRFNPEPDRRTGFVTRNLLTAPMKDLDGKPLGVIQAVNKITVPFSENDTALIELLAEQAGVAIQRQRLQDAALEVVALRHEMELARRTQQALIPKAAPSFPGFEAAGWTSPASATGGDCFDLWKLPDGRLGVFLADASGHGLAPALIVSQVRSIVRALSEIESDPHRVLARVNARLYEDLDWGQFVTAFLAFLGPDGWLQWSSAGHGPSFLRARCAEPASSLEPPVQPLGVLDSWLDEPPPRVLIEPTGSLVLLSDGLFEALSPAGEQFGIPRVVQTIDDQPDSCKPGEIIAALRGAVRTWLATGEPQDDQTIVVVERM